MHRLSRAALASVIGALVAIAVLPRPLRADTWEPPTTRMFTSANALYRVTVLPHYPHAPPEAGEKERPLAMVERFESARFMPDWERKLENRIAPLDALISNDGAYLVTLDNYAAVGKGDNVVVIYRRGGELVRKLSLGQLLPPEYVRYLTRTTSTIAWRGAHSLAEGDTVLVVQVYEPGSGDERYPKHVPVRIRLADGAVFPHAGPEWADARSKIAELEERRQGLWEAERGKPTPDGKPLPETPPENFGLDGWQPYYD